MTLIEALRRKIPSETVEQTKTREARELKARRDSDVKNYVSTSVSNIADTYFHSMGGYTPQKGYVYLKWAEDNFYDRIVGKESYVHAAFFRSDEESAQDVRLIAYKAINELKDANKRNQEKRMSALRTSRRIIAWGIQTSQAYLDEDFDTEWATKLVKDVLAGRQTKEDMNTFLYNPPLRKE